MRTDSHSQLLNMCVIGITSCINLACICPLRSSNPYSSTNDEHSRALNWSGTFNITMIHSTCKIFQGFPWSHSKAFASFPSHAVHRPPPAFHHLQYPGLHQLSITCMTVLLSFPSLAAQYTASDGKLGGGLGRRLDVPINLFRKSKTNFQATESPLPYMENMRRQFVTNLVTRMDEPE